MLGKEFQFDDKTRLIVQNILRNETFKRKPVASVDPNAPFFNLIIPVTGASSNHLRKVRRILYIFQSNFQGKE